MKRMNWMGVVFCAIILAACNNKAEKPAETKMADTPKKGIDIKVAALASNKDLVCGMPVEEGSIGDTTTLDGKIYAFCSSECKAEFLKNPQSYLVQK